MSRETYISLDTKGNNAELPKLQHFTAKSPHDNRLVEDRLAGGIRMPISVEIFIMQNHPEIGESIIKSFSEGELEEFVEDVSFRKGLDTDEK